jgi:hypothetical protein
MRSCFKRRDDPHGLLLRCLLLRQVVLDGELLGTTPVAARVLPNSLRVLVPPPVAPPPAAADAEVVHKIAEQDGVHEEVAAVVVEKLGVAAAAKLVDDPQQHVEDKPVVAPSTEQSR